jgi:hypothetical protein
MTGPILIVSKAEAACSESDTREPPACSTTARNALLRLAANIVTIPPNDQPIMPIRLRSTKSSVLEKSAVARTSSPSACILATKRGPRSCPISSEKVGPSERP